MTTVSSAPGAPASPRRRLLGLGALAVIGLASLLAAPVERIMPLPLPTMTVRVLAIVQPAILTAGALLVGLLLGPKVGLDAPILAGRLRLEARSAPQLRALGTASLIVAIVAAGLLYGYEQNLATFTAGLSGEGRATLEAFQPPLVTRVLYGGLVEEIISRWGLMTLFVWLIARIARRRGAPATWVYWSGAALAAFLFALGHLPLLFSLFDAPPMTLIATVLALNAIIGFGFGWLFARYGLEAAMLSHALTHLIAASLSGGLA
ncbi:CPBP family intramembrane metalloprotease [Sphingomonas ursincola]|uniref:CPBP family glutamic-type intramembrane protease n=1 Tax=Sphingomonas ursincola TaxID=56361 RepID=UPI0015E6E42A|nr:CPBP family glutamic-type intramembrane protease [Sphingomonas ursincola]